MQAKEERKAEAAVQVEMAEKEKVAAQVKQEKRVEAALAQVAERERAMAQAEEEKRWKLHEGKRLRQLVRLFRSR